MPDSYLKVCSSCDQLVRLQEDLDGAWQSMELEGEAPHDCTSVPAIDDGWTLGALGHPLICRLDCWWCGEEVFFRTNGNGRHVLFDRLAWPWPLHNCWAERPDERERAVRKLESDLRARGYRGQGRLIGVAPASVPDSVPNRGRTNPPDLQIRLSGSDHQIVDNAVRQVVRFISERHPQTPVPVPLPVDVEVEGPGTGDDPSPDGKPFTQHVHRRAIDIWAARPELVAQLTQVQLPEAAEVSIRQA